jgi:hypothetical protein
MKTGQIKEDGNFDMGKVDGQYKYCTQMGHLEKEGITTKENRMVNGLIGMNMITI